MTSTLHIITDPRDRLPLEAIAQEGGATTILLMQDGVCADVETSNVYACADDVRARGLECRHPLVDYDGIIDLLTGHDRVVCWH